jgi:GT2 family glycosyltransferase
MPADPPCTLSIVIPTWNRADLLRACLRSVVRHAPAGTEIIVVADGPYDTNVDEFPGVRLIRLPRRGGFCAAANAGIAAAHGDVVELLNDDTEVTAGWAETALACFADPWVAAVAPLVLLNQTVIDSAGDGYDSGGFACKHGHGEPLTAARLTRREVFGASGSSAFYRRELLLRVGNFPQHFGAYFEDVDLAFRLRRAGGLIVFEPASVVLHHGGSSHGRAGRRLVEQQSCNEERVWWRNLSPRDLVRSLPRHLAVLTGKAIRRWGEGTLLPWACGRLRAWSEIGACRRHQKQLARLAPGVAFSKLPVEPNPIG